MTTVAQLIAKLQTLPQDAEVECNVEKWDGYATYVTTKSVDIEYTCVADYSDTAKYPHLYPHLGGKTVVYLDGE